jgi:hypothetical protein
MVVDDVTDATPCTKGQTVIRPEPFWKAGVPTLNRNFQVGLAAMTTDIVVIIEDDDYYAPLWLETIYNHFSNSDDKIVGEGWTTYYHVETLRYHRHSNSEHASLCATAFRREILPEVLSVLNSLQLDDPFLDVPIWTALLDQGTLWDTRHVVGIKGMPGRPGAGRGHRSSFSFPNVDPGYHNLEAWLGADADVYKGRCTDPKWAGQEVKPFRAPSNPHRKEPVGTPSNAMPPNMRSKGQCSKN